MASDGPSPHSPSLRLGLTVTQIHLFSKVLDRCHRVSHRRFMYLLGVGSDYCVMRFAYALHMRRQNLVLLSCSYTEPLELIFHYCTTPPCHKIDCSNVHFGELL